VESATSTLQGLDDGLTARRSRLLHLAATAGVSLVLIVALLGWFGPRSATLVATTGPHRMTVEYPAITRSGVPAPFRVRIEQEQDFTGPVRIAVSDSFYEEFDFQNWYPNPATEIGEIDRVVYEFDPPAGNRFEVSLDARTGPGQLGGKESYTAQLLSETGDVLVSIDFETLVVP